MFRPWLTRIAVLALLLPALAPTPAAAHDDHHRDCTALSPAERAELERAMRQLGESMERLGRDLSRELGGLADESDWEELATLGEQIRREIEGEIDADAIAREVRRELEDVDWEATAGEIRELVREVTHEAGFAARDASRIAREAARVARRALAEHHHRHHCDHE